MNTLQTLKKQLEALRKEKQPLILQLQSRIDSQQDLIRKLTQKLMQYQEKVHLNKLSALDNSGLVLDLVDRVHGNKKYVLLDVTALSDEDIFITNVENKFVRHQQVEVVLAQVMQSASIDYVGQSNKIEKEVLGLQDIVKQLRSQMDQLKKKYEENGSNFNIGNVYPQSGVKTGEKQSLSTPEILQRESFNSADRYMSNELNKIKQQKPSIDISIGEVSSQLIRQDTQSDRMLNTYPSNINKKQSNPHTYKSEDKVNKKIVEQQKQSQEDRASHKHSPQSSKNVTEESPINIVDLGDSSSFSNNNEYQQLKSKQNKVGVEAGSKGSMGNIKPEDDKSKQGSQAKDKSIKDQLKLTTYIGMGEENKQQKRQKAPLRKFIDIEQPIEKIIQGVAKYQLQKIEEESQRNQSSQQTLQNTARPSQRDNQSQTQFNTFEKPDKTNQGERSNSNKVRQNSNNQNQRKSENSQKLGLKTAKSQNNNQQQNLIKNEEKQDDNIKPKQIKTQTISDKSGEALTPLLTNKQTKTSQQELSIEKDIKRQKREDANAFQNYPQATIKIPNSHEGQSNKQSKSNGLMKEKIEEKAIQEEQNQSKKDENQKKQLDSKEESEEDLRSAQKLPSKQQIKESEKSKQMESEWKPLSINQNSSLQLSFPKSPVNPGLKTPSQQIKNGLKADSVESLNEMFNKQQSSSIGEVSSPSAQSMKKAEETTRQNAETEKSTLTKPLSLDSQAIKQQSSPPINQSLSMPQSMPTPLSQNDGQKQTAIFKSNISKIDEISSDNNSGASQHPSIKQIHSMLTTNKNVETNKIDEQNIVNQQEKQKKDEQNLPQEQSKDRQRQQKQTKINDRNINQARQTDKDNLELDGQQKSVQKSKQAIPIKLIRDSANSKEVSVKSSSLDISPIKLKQSIQDNTNKQKAEATESQKNNEGVNKYNEAKDDNKEFRQISEKDTNQMKMIPQQIVKQQEVQQKQENQWSQTAQNNKIISDTNRTNSQTIKNDPSPIQTNKINNQHENATVSKKQQQQRNSKQQQKQSSKQILQQKVQPSVQLKPVKNPQQQTQIKTLTQPQAQTRTQSQTQPPIKLPAQQKQKDRKSKASNQSDSKSKANAVKSPKGKDQTLNWRSLFSAFPSDNKKDTKLNKQSKNQTEKSSNKPKQAELNTNLKQPFRQTNQSTEIKGIQSKQPQTQLNANESIQKTSELQKTQTKQNEQSCKEGTSQNNNMNNKQKTTQSNTLKAQNRAQKLEEANNQLYNPVTPSKLILQTQTKQNQTIKIANEENHKKQQVLVPVDQQLQVINQNLNTSKQNDTNSHQQPQAKQNELSEVQKNIKQEPKVIKNEQAVQKDSKTQAEVTRTSKQQRPSQKQTIQRESANKPTQTKQPKVEDKKQTKQQQLGKTKEHKTQTKDHHEKQKHKKQAEPLPNWNSLFPTFSSTKKPQHKETQKKHHVPEKKVEPEVKQQSKKQQPIKEIKVIDNQAQSKKSEISEDPNQDNNIAQSLKIEDTNQAIKQKQQTKTITKKQPQISQFQHEHENPAAISAESNKQRQSKKLPPPLINIQNTASRQDSPQFNFQVKSPSIIVSKPDDLGSSAILQKKSTFKQARKQSVLSSQKSLEQIDDEYERMKKLTKQAEIKEQEELDKLIEELNQQETKEREATRKKQKQQEEQKKLQRQKAQQAQLNEKPVEPQQNIDSQIKQLFMFGGGGRSSSKKQRQSKNAKSKQKQKPKQEAVTVTMTRSGRRVIEPSKPTQFMIKHGSGEQLKKSLIQALQENAPVIPTDDNIFDNFLVISGDYSDQSDKQKGKQSPIPIQQNQLLPHKLKYRFSYEPEQSQGTSKFEKKVSNEGLQQASKSSLSLPVTKNLQLKIPSVIGALVEGTLLNESSTPYPVEKPRKKSSDLSQLNRPSREKLQQKNVLAPISEKKSSGLSIQVPSLDTDKQDQKMIQKVDENVKVSDTLSTEIKKQNQISKTKSEQPSTQFDKQSLRKSEDKKKVKSKVFHFRKD